MDMQGKRSSESCTVFDFVEFPCSENAAASDASLFMDGFLYISTGPAKMTQDRRGRDGERKSHFSELEVKPINPFVHSLSCMFVRGLPQLSPDRSINVNLSTVKLPIV